MAGTSSLLGLMALALIMATAHVHAAPATCSAGFYNPTKGTDVAKSCVPCPKDFYSGDNGNCLPCPANSTGPLGRWALSSCHCRPGFRFDASFRLPKPQCSICAAGSYCLGGPSYDKACPPGTYNPKPGATNISACLPCPKGTFARTFPGGALQCKKCPAASSGPDESAGSCNCPAGTYFNEGYGSKAIPECTPCRAGYYCPGGSGRFPEPCPSGSISKEGAKSAAACTKCTKGTYPTGTGCTKCPKGTLGSNPDNSACLCPPGQEWQGGAIGMCTPCEAGNYCQGGDKTAELCWSGTYNTKEGSKSDAACLECPANTYSLSDPKVDRSGPSECYPCPTKATSRPGSSSCTCPSGQFFDRGSCNICPVGTLGSPKPGYMTDIRCNCPNGTFWANSNYNGIPWCYPCPASTLGSNGDTTACVCPAGAYWSTDGDTPQCIKCPKNTYQPEKGAVGDVCIPCDEGQCSEEGAEECNISC